MNTIVKDTRTIDDGETIRRRRECEDCGVRFTSYERYAAVPTMVIKKDGSTQPYDRSKIERGLLQACHKRPVSAEQIEQMMGHIERKIFASDAKSREIQSSEIGNIVLEELRAVDSVAFIRFASIYKEFNNLETFRRELDKLEG